MHAQWLLFGVGRAVPRVVQLRSRCVWRVNVRFKYEEWP